MSFTEQKDIKAEQSLNLLSKDCEYKNSFKEQL